MGLTVNFIWVPAQGKRQEDEAIEHAILHCRNDQIQRNKLVKSPSYCKNIENVENIMLFIIFLNGVSCIKGSIFNIFIYLFLSFGSHYLPIGGGNAWLTF